MQDYNNEHSDSTRRLAETTHARAASELDFGDGSAMDATSASGLNLGPGELARSGSAGAVLYEEGTEEARMAQEALGILFSDSSQLYCFRDSRPHRLMLIGDDSDYAHERADRVKQDNLQRRRKAMLMGDSCGIFGPQSGMRKTAVLVVTNDYFDNLIMVLIAFSAVLLALDNPSNKKGTSLALFLSVSDIIMTVIFTGEMMIKLVAMGVIFTPDAYFLNGWNILDGIIVCISLLTLALSNLELGFLKSLRAMRALRPLRMISRNPNMKMVVNALIQALPDVANVTLVVIGFFVIFGITGGTLLRGGFYWCDGEEADRTTRSMLECNGTYFDDATQTTMTREWNNHAPNYDSLPQALITLFEIATLEGWPSIMWNSLDVTQPDKHPSVNASKGVALFYVLFVTVGSFFVINIFVGVVVHKFQVAKDDADGKSLFLSEQQRDYVEHYKQLLGAGHPRPFIAPRSSGYLQVVRMAAFEVVTAPRFDIAIMVVILLNVISISLEHYNKSAAWILWDLILNLFFTAIFGLEMIAKIIGLGFKQYWTDQWNKFDFVIVIFSVGDVVLGFANSALPINMSLFRIMRVARMAKLLKTDKGLRALFQTLISSIAALMNVGSLLVLLFFVFAVMGMNLFSEADRDGEFITHYNNFESFGYSMLTLFRCLTGEDWNAIMQALYDQGFVAAYPFFIIFIIVGNFMLLNLFIAVILESFAELMETDPSSPDDHKDDFEHMIDDFKSVWGQHDPDARMFVKSYRLIAILKQLPAYMQERMGLFEIMNLGGRSSIARMTDPDDRRKVRLDDSQAIERRFMVEYIRDLRIKVDAKGHIFYLDVLAAVMHHIRGFNGVDLATISENTTNVLTSTLSNMVHPSLKRKMARSRIDTSDAELDLTHEMNAAIAIQHIWNTKKTRRRFEQDLTEAGRWTPGLDHLFHVTLAQFGPARGIEEDRSP